MAISTAVEKEKEGRTLRGKMLTAGILVALFVFAMAIRCVWYFDPAVAPAETYGQYHYVVSGNDPDYHKRSIDYALETGHALTWDPLMNYPVGGPNPNPPAFAWSSMFIGIALSPAFSFDVIESVWMFFLVVPAFWAALTIFPIYFFTRDMFGRKPAYLASFIIAVMAGNVERTPLGFSDHDSIVVFFVVVGFFFLLRALKNLEEKKWVAKWSRTRDISIGLLGFLRMNRISLLYSVMAGFAIAAVMLSWKGVAYVFAILTMYLIAHVLIKRFRKEDPLGVAMCVLVALGVALLVSFPYYYGMQFMNWYETPFFVFTALALFTAITIPTRDQPYLLVLAGLGIIVAAALAVIYLWLPGIYNTLLGFQGYFIHDKLYQTIAEAQPPDFSRMVYSYGEYIFYFGLVAIVYSAYRLPKERWRNDYIFSIVWFAMAIYMAMSAVRFMYNATPVFAILGGYVTWVIFDLLDYKKMVRTFRGLAGGDKWHALKSSVKVRHVAGAIFLGYMVLASATFYGLDAGIPYETKKEFDNGIYNALPTQLRPANYNPDGSDLWWFGSFGTAFPGDSWTDAMFWFQTQDTAYADLDRPAFVAWWDYGHWCMHMGHHPSIADNFQQGVQISGNIITSQNETQVIAYFLSRVVEGNESNPEVVPILKKYLGEDGTADFQEIMQMTNIPHWRKEVLAHPAIYGNRTKDINDLNVRWTALCGLLTQRLTKAELVVMYDQVNTAIGKEIRYFAADYRMFPFQATNTGIYYAPVKLSDQDINDFLVVRAVGSDYQEYDPANIPESVRQDQDFRIVEYKLYYTEMFYNSLFYRAYVGYSPAEAGMQATSTNGYTDVPSMVGNMRTGQYPPMQGWNMTNFRLEYRTAYWNAYNESTGLANHSADWKVVPPWDAKKYEAEEKGVVDNFYRNLYQGVFMLKYYDGAIVSGTVATDTGLPVPNARVTVYDDVPLAISYYPGVPHGCTFTDAQGRYSLIAPYGNVTVRVTNGGQSSADDLLLVKEKRELGSAGFFVSDDQAMRHPIDLNGDGIMDYNIRQDFTVQTGNLSGRAYYDMNVNGAFDDGLDTPLTGELQVDNATVGRHYTAALDAGGNYTVLNMTPADYALTLGSMGVDIDGGTASVDAGAAATADIKLVDITLSGNVTYENGTLAEGLAVGVLDANGTVLGQNTSMASGAYLIEKLLPGDYDVSIITEGYLREALPITVNQTENQTLELVAIPLHTVSLTANLSSSGQPAAGAAVSFQNLDNATRSASVRVGADGSAGAMLAQGNYTAYAVMAGQPDMFVALRNFAVGSEPVELELSLAKGQKLNGTVFRDTNGNGTYDPVASPSLPGSLDQTSTLAPEHQSASDVEVEGPDGRLVLPCNMLGYFEAYLPSGQYVLRAEKNTSETASYVNVTFVDLSAPVWVNLSVSSGAEVTGTVFWDRNRNDSPDPGDELAGARLLMTDKKRPERTVEIHTLPNGTFRIFLPQSTEFGVNASAAGFNTTYDSFTTGTDPLARNIELDPTGVLADLGFMVGDEPAPQGLKVRLTGITDGAAGAELATDARGHVRATLMPGQYNVLVDQNATVSGGLVNLTMVALLNVSAEQASLEQAFKLNLLVFLSGVVYQDENADGVPQRAEYRNALVKFLPEGLMGDPAASAPGMPAVPMASQETVEGRYSMPLPIGNYTVWALVQMPTPEGPDQVFMQKAAVDASGTLNISLSPACKARGLVYTDLNGNGAYDEGESRSGVGIALKEGNDTLMALASDSSGYYEVELPQGRLFVLDIDNATEETLSEGVFVPIRYVGSHALTTPPATFHGLNLTVARLISVGGRVTYGAAGGTVRGVAGIGVLFTQSNGTQHRAITNATGNYSIYIGEMRYNLSVDAPGYNSSVKDLSAADVSLERTDFSFALSAVNATVSLTLYHNGAPAVLPGGAQVSFQALDKRAVNVSGRTDPQGRLQIEAAPGSYALYVTALRNGVHLAYFGPLDLEPSGAPVALRIDILPAARLWGFASYRDAQGALASPAAVDLVLNTTMTVADQNLTARLDFPGQGPSYELFVPAANYTVDASFMMPVEGRNITYNMTSPLNISPGQSESHLDLPLAKVKDYSLGLYWDSAQKVTVPANSTVNYTLHLTNKGNERTTVSLQVSKPGGWSVELSIEKVTLELGENLTVLVNLTVPEGASAGDNAVTINASASDAPERFHNISSMMVNVVQSYAVTMGAADAGAKAVGGGVVYNIKVSNGGNGEDTFNLSVTGPHGWTLALSEYNPVIGGGQSKDIQLTATPFSGARIEKGLTAHVRAVSKNEQAPPADLTVNLTFPKLGVSGFKATGKGASAPQQAMPGFGAALVLAAAAAAAVVAVRKRRGPQ